VKTLTPLTIYSILRALWNSGRETKTAAKEQDAATKEATETHCF